LTGLALRVSSEVPPLDPAEASRILKVLEPVLDEEQAVLVGGQALIVLADELGLEEDLFTSQDLDFVGNRRVVARCADLLGGEAKYPDRFDNTPHTGIVLFRDSQGYRRQLDVLSSLFAISGEDVRQRAIPIGDVLVLHPLQALQDKVAGLGRLRSDEMATRQAGVAVAAVRQFVCLLLDHEDVSEGDRMRQAHRINRAVFDLACGADGIRAYESFGVDVLGAVVEDHPLIPEAARTKDYPRRRARVDAKRDRLRRPD